MQSLQIVLDKKKLSLAAIEGAVGDHLENTLSTFTIATDRRNINLKSM
jgi:hypothetical protein